MEIFEKAYIGSCELKNRTIRSATFEGMCDANGFPGESYYALYDELSKNNIGGIITGFAFISEEGKAIQPGQAGIYSEDFIKPFKKVTAKVHENGSKIFMQLAHTGRQTRSKEINRIVVGASQKKSPYFREKPKQLSKTEIVEIIEKFGNSANFAKQAGFDGVQIHAAHGYLVHQFLLPGINNRKDEFGIDTKRGLGLKFLDLVIDKIREKCGEDFPILIKISGSDDYKRKFSSSQFSNLIMFLDLKKIAAIEISYGTMDHALNIFRGDVPVNLILKYNKVYKVDNKIAKWFLKSLVFPFFKTKLQPFTPMYNLQYAEIAKQLTTIPIISVGGFREKSEIEYAIKEKNVDFVSLSRPFIAEPDFALKLSRNGNYKSKCINCNYCAIMCDSKFSTKCYKGGEL
ncbi:MAG: NADH:flavin oxidoreductase [Bacteroidales bacterium]|nr:NADH:flavin oxidoreductase [Bacteroidales bacterium]MCF8455561.1 NADH:flavin oxidoreductase [Bacteroidales bacterium]